MLTYLTSDGIRTLSNTDLLKYLQTLRGEKKNIMDYAKAYVSELLMVKQELRSRMNTLGHDILDLETVRSNSDYFYNYVKTILQ